MRAGGSFDNAGRVQHRQMVRVRRARREGACGARDYSPFVVGAVAFFLTGGLLLFTLDLAGVQHFSPTGHLKRLTPAQRLHTRSVGYINSQ